MTERTVYTIEVDGTIAGYAVNTNPRQPDELTLTTANGITLLAVAMTLDEAAGIFSERSAVR